MLIRRLFLRVMFLVIINQQIQDKDVQQLIKRKAHKKWTNQYVRKLLDLSQKKKNQLLLYKKIQKKTMKRNLIQIIQLIFRYVIVDKNLNICEMNEKMKQMSEISDIQQVLQTLSIVKLDKYSSIQMKWKKSQEHSFNQESFASILVQFRNFHQLKELFSGMKLYSIWTTQIIDYTSSFIPETYFITVNYNQKDDNYKLSFVNVEERDYYQQKKTTIHLMNQLFRSFSHEFSTSLNCIQLSTASLMEELDSEFKDSYLNPIINSCKLLNSILSDVKDFSLILQKKLMVSIGTISLVQVIENAYQLFKMQISMKGLNFLTNIQVDILNNDENKIKQILINLLSNSQKYTQSGFIEIGTKKVTINQDKYIKIWVKDTGPGLDQNEKDRLNFVLKNQMGFRKDQQKSLGIGLMISNQLALKLSNLRKDEGGGIQFESDENGSQFWIYVSDFNQDVLSSVKSKKFIKSHKVDKQSFQSSVKSAKSIKQSQNISIRKLSGDKNSENLSQSLSSYKDMKKNFDQIYFGKQVQLGQCSCKPILIIDDEYFNIMSLSFLLKKFNYECDFAYNGQEGYEKVIHKYKNPCYFCKQNYKLILMDIEMPLMNGIEAAKKIQEFTITNSLIKPTIVAQSAYIDYETKQKAQEVGMKYFLSKPIQKDELYGLIQQYL